MPKRFPSSAERRIERQCGLLVIEMLRHDRLFWTNLERTREVGGHPANGHPDL
jgi:hypothetical protein